MMPKMNKKADAGELTMWLMKGVLLIFVAMAISMIVLNFYSMKMDIRQSEAMFIGKRIVDCLTDNGIISLEKFNDAKIKKCLNFNEKSNEIRIENNLVDLDNKKLKEPVSFGNEDLNQLCEYDILCSRQKYYFLTYDGKKIELSMFIAIRKTEKNV